MTGWDVMHTAGCRNVLANYRGGGTLPCGEFRGSFNLLPESNINISC